MSKKVIVAGSIITDMSVMVNTHPIVGETVVGSELSYSPGGKGANQAVAAKRLGADVKMIGKIGNNNRLVDSNGLMCLDFLREESIDCSGVSGTKEAPTGIAMIVVSKETGNNNIVVMTGANDYLNPVDISINMEGRDDYYNKTDLLNEGDILVAQFETPLESTKRFFEFGREKNSVNILNPAPAKIIPDCIMNLVDILILNESELFTILGQPSFNASKVIEKWHDSDSISESISFLLNGYLLPNIVIVTLGKYGAFGMINSEHFMVEAIKVNAIDTTGAGDCFVGAIAAFSAKHTIVDALSLREAINFANKAASISVTIKGSGISMPYKNELGRII